MSREVIWCARDMLDVPIEIPLSEAVAYPGFYVRGVGFGEEIIRIETMCGSFDLKLTVQQKRKGKK